MSVERARKQKKGATRPRLSFRLSVRMIVRVDVILLAVLLVAAPAASTWIQL